MGCALYSDFYNPSYSLFRIIHDLADVTTPLRQFTDAVNAPDPDIGRKRKNVDLKGQNLKMFSTRLSKTATVVAYANAKNKRRSDSLQILRYSYHTCKKVICYAIWGHFLMEQAYLGTSRSPTFRPTH